jgi:catechol-2,3-dioxygenase
MLDQIKLAGVTIDCKDPKKLSEFYIKLLGWEISYEDDTFTMLSSPTCNVRIGFQKNEDYIPPVWPEVPNTQQQQAHLDFKVKDKEHMNDMVEYAIVYGAKKASEQYSDLWTVMIDPAGHPFCLDTL